MTAVLKDSATNLISSGVSFEYRYGWGAKMPFSGSMELLPINTKMTVNYMGAAIENEQDANSNPNFVFNTVPVTAVLKDSGGNNLGGASFEYRYGWDAKQPFTSPTELLPVNTKITVNYGGASVEKEQNAGTNPNFVFNTVAVSAVLKDSGGTPIASGVTFDYRYGWGAYSSFTSPMELLPVNTKITVNYAGASIEKEQNAATNAAFEFQTGSVTSSTCSRYRYGYGSYMTFSSPMELIPVATKFADADGPDVQSTPVAGGTINVNCP